MYQHQPSNVVFNRSYRMPHVNSSKNFLPRGSRYRHYPNYHGPPQPPLHHIQLQSHEEYWCETCDRGFRTPDMLDSHKQQHQKCKIDGCEFIAHPKVIIKHIQMQHSTGLFKKIGNLSKPEDIDKWREERKKKYPTKENVERKAAELKEKIERGEKMGLKRDNKIKGGEAQKRKFSNSAKNYSEDKIKRNANPDNHIYSNNKGSKRKKKEDILPPPETFKTLKPFAGILNLTLETDKEIKEDQQCTYEIEDDDEYLKEVVSKDTKYESGVPSVCGALSTLMCEYGSSDEEIDIKVLNTGQTNVRSVDVINLQKNDPKSNKYETIRQTLHGTSSTYKNENNFDVELKQNSDDDSPPEEVKVEKFMKSKSDNENLYPKHEKSKKNKNNYIKRPVNRPKPKLPSTLLQKLLQKEIQQERNIVLQCIRHIVKNNYFGQ